MGPIQFSKLERQNGSPEHGKRDMALHVFVMYADLTYGIYRTFQEGLLSRRMLVFTEHQTSFYCSANSWIEGFGNPDPNAARERKKIRHPHHFFRSSLFLKSSSWSWGHLASIIEDYSARKITKEADTLDAILGVTNHIRRSQPTTELLRGLPFYKPSASETTLLDSFEDLITAALSWHSCENEDSSPQRKPTFPSWTWAGWSGEAEFWLRYIHETRHRSLLRNARLESLSEQTVVSSTLYKNNIQRELDTVTLIQFEAPMIPAASFERVKSPWADSDSDEDDYVNLINFQVSGRRVYRNTYPGIYPFERLIENVRRGLWLCLVLCTGRCSEEGRAYEEQSFVLVVRLKADQMTAERVGSFQLYSSPSEDARLGPFAEGWTWRRVRLI